MQFSHVRTSISADAPAAASASASAVASRVTALAWAPNAAKFAAVGTDRVVHLFDENGDRRDKFATKPADKGPKNYIVTGLAFSPDSTRVAVAQSDCMVYVYKLGAEWADKKSICNKFAAASPVTCIVWPTGGPSGGGEIVFGCQDGRARVCISRSNKSQTCHAGETFLLSLAAGMDGLTVFAAHVDGSVYRIGFDDAGGMPSSVKILTHGCGPSALAAGGDALVAAGPDGRVTFYDFNGAPLRTFDYADEALSGGPSMLDFTVAAFNPTGEAVVLGSFNKFVAFSQQRTSAAAPGSFAGAFAASTEWTEACVKSVDGLYLITALAWKPDGSKLAVGSLTGSVEMFDACIRKTRYGGKFEFTYVSPSTVIVKRLSSGVRIVLRSSFGYEISRIRVFKERFLVAATPKTLLAGDLETCRLSEVPWHGNDAPSSGRLRERYFFDNPAVAMIYRAGELTLIEYGRTDVLGSCRTEYMSPHTVSVRVHEKFVPTGSPSAAAAAGAATKVIAYLLDSQTLRVQDLGSTASPPATIHHDSKVDWLELNARGTLLLVRDKRHRLHLYDVAKGTKSTLLPFCNYAQWVPDSDVVVAQRRTTLCVWYNIRAPERVTTDEIRGDVEDIVRSAGKTEVIVDEGLTTASYTLDEGLIAFGSAMDDGNLAGALASLEMLETTPETQGMWSQLGEAALATGDLIVAERCAIALGDVSRARFLHKTWKVAQLAAQKLGGDGRDFWMVRRDPRVWSCSTSTMPSWRMQVRARLAQLRHDVAAAEAIFLEQGKVEEAVEMYQTLHMWDDALAVAEANGLPDAAAMRDQFVKYLMDSGQEERAAALKEREGDTLAAIALYLRGGYPARAALLVSAQPASFSKEVTEKVTSALAAAGMYDRAGTLLERMGDASRALEAYTRGNAFRPAVELARRAFPTKVVELERAWGKWLASQGQWDTAINHFIEAGEHVDAIESALAARQHSRAAQLLSDTLGEGSRSARPFWRRLALHAAETGDTENAEKCFMRCGDGRAAVDMYLGRGEWAAAHRVGRAVLPEQDLQALFASKAAELEAAGNLRGAEKVYTTAGNIDAAVTMYKRAKQWDSLIRLVSTTRPSALREMQLMVARTCATDGANKQAEHYFVEAGEWEAAVAMYRNANMWEDAMRIARVHGGAAAAHRVAYAQAVALGGEAGLKLLTRLGLPEQALAYAIEIGHWDFALELAAKQGAEAVAAVHLKHGLALEDDGDFAKAEVEFIAADKPREAIDMYLHSKDWAAALRIAETYDPTAAADVLIAQAGVAVAARDFAGAEALYIDAKRPDLAVESYLNARAFPEALRVAKRYLPHKVNELNERIKRAVAAGSTAYGSAPSASPVEPSSTQSSSGSRSRSGGASAVAAAASVPAAAPVTVAAAAVGDALANARAWEKSRDYALAIDGYLGVGGASDGVKREAAVLEEAWVSAVRLAATHDRARHYDITEEVAHRLTEIDCQERAGDLFNELEQSDRAAECYVAAGAWAKAREAARSAPIRVREAVEAAYKSHLMKSGDADGMAAAGAMDAAIATYATNRQFDKLFEAASKAGSATLAKYLYPYVEEQLATHRVLDVVAALAKYGAPAMPSQLHLFQKLVAKLFTGTVSSKLPDAAMHDMRDVLYKMVAALRKPSAEVSPAQLSDFDRLLLVVHYASSRARCVEMGLPDLAARMSISLLRFTNIVPADRAFYEAGIACKQQGWKSAAFVFLNRYLDIAEAIDDGGDMSGLDNSDFVGTGVLPPTEFSVINRHFVEPEAAREEIKSWILATSIDARVEQSLPQRPCFSCGTRIFEGAVGCGTCKATFPSCVITGYPIPATQTAVCNACNSKALKPAWNAVVGKTKVCPWCAAPASPAL